MDYQKQLIHLLDQCQDTWVCLQSSKDVDGARSRKDMRVAIKQLVQLQDDFDDLHTMGDTLSWEKHAQTLSHQVTEQVNLIRKSNSIATTRRQPIEDQASPKDQFIDRPTTPAPAISALSSNYKLKPPTTTESPIRVIPPTDHSFHQSRPLLSLSTPWSSKIQDGVKVYDFQRPSLDRSPPSSPSEDDASSIATIATTTSDLCPSASLSESHSNHSMNSLLLPPQQSPDATRFNLVPSTIAQQTFMTEGPPEPCTQKDRRSRLSLPFPFKKISSSYSSPVSGPLVQISLYKDTSPQSFAADAIVDHPLRIGVGYGSYICYSCTVISNKGTPITIRKRYSDFVHVRQQLIKLHPNKTLPKLPPKKLVKKFDPVFVEQRRRELEYFFRYIVLHPTFGSSTVVKQWIAP
ncbi:hypothetical protein [Absidia glauca]|uniref:Sorting nexin MVP1 n=1 Tax=Absidia glauca TaxID=4829 RepID=A0A163IU10_ABSGL|nr:hypothetical protein [Absidia glauca]